MGIETVAVYSTADRDSLHVALADQSVCIGPPPSAQSYLVKENLITAALKTGCDAVHPGVGFLSENASFARLAADKGLLFIGPEASAIELLGDKVTARNTALRNGLPVTPGTEGALESAAEARDAVGKLGFPIIIKAASGGGGKGMRIVRSMDELEENLSLASREALANFADGRVFIERYLENPRHVELQLVCDGHGSVAILGERDCTVQRNHQKLIEESPSPGVTDTMRRHMAESSSRLFSDIAYRGAGTIEFLVEGDDFYFMEVNARVQVEHPVSEMVSGVDIIRQQILACACGKMELPSGAHPVSGWAVECRVNALSPGTVKRLEIPGGPGVRFDSFVYSGYAIPPYYDALLGKLIVHHQDRENALRRMERSLDELLIEGIETNIEEQKRIISHPVFRSGEYGTSFYHDEVKNGKN
jgi:acetyl-CoA carboxylase biotin carboxylase subunit